MLSFPPVRSARVLIALLPLLSAHKTGKSHNTPHSYRHYDAENGSLQFDCGTEEKSAAEVRKLALPDGHRGLLAKVYQTPDGHHKRRRLQNYAVEVVEFPLMVFHVITDGYTGFLSDAQLQAQFDHLNDAFGPYIQFNNWARLDYNSSTLFNSGCDIANEGLLNDFKNANAVTTALNTYFLDCLSWELFGFSTFPFDYPEDSRIHGTVNDYRTIDDSRACSGGCQGDTLVHEWGHGFGLFHTFQSLAPDQCDCTWNDLVRDTPPVFEPNYGGYNPNGADCVSINSCSEPNDRADALENYMDYSDDYCLSEFTEGQFERMLYMLALYKPNMISSSLNSADPRACIIGTYFDETFERCVACPPGEYQDEAGQTSCKPCPLDALDQTIIGEEFGLGTLRFDIKQCYDLQSPASCIESWFQDSYCDKMNNNEECYFDGGDCCEDCCNDFFSEYSCGSGDQGYQNFQQCLDSSCDNSDLPTRGSADTDECFDFGLGEGADGGAGGGGSGDGSNGSAIIVGVVIAVAVSIIAVVVGFTRRLCK